MYEAEVLDAKRVVREFMEKSGLDKGALVVIGCSTSEIVSCDIGSNSVAQLGELVFCAMHDEFEKYGIEVAAQCCEHLNRALIIEKETAYRRGYEQVNVIPAPKAGGSFATGAWKHFTNPVAVEFIRADGGIDIGDTLIGMHIRSVAVPLRIMHPCIGKAHIVCARTRPKFIGGERAHYNELLM